MGVDTAVLLSLANQLLLKLLPQGGQGHCWCLSAPLSRLSPLVLWVALGAWGRAAGRAELGGGAVAQPAQAAGIVGFIYIVGWGLGKKQTGQNPPLWDPDFLCCCAFFHLSSIRCCDLLGCHALIICLGQLNCQVNGE